MQGRVHEAASITEKLMPVVGSSASCQDSSSPGSTWPSIFGAAISTTSLTESEVRSGGKMDAVTVPVPLATTLAVNMWTRSEEHTSELQSLMRISYAVFCLTKKTTNAQYERDKNRNEYVRTTPTI